MKKQTLIWTALPNGLVPAAGGQPAYLRLSVFVSPRLSVTTQAEETGLTLAAFPDFLDWPAKLAGLTLTAHFEGRGDKVGERVAPAADPPPSDLWKALFPATRWVKSYEDPPIDKLTFSSFSVANLHARIRETYQTLSVVSMDKLPEVNQTNPVMPMIKEIALTPQISQAINKSLQTRMQGTQAKLFTPPAYRSPRMFRAGATARTVGPAAAAPLAGVSAAKLDFHQLADFHAPAVSKAKLPKLTPAMLTGTIDFHKVASSLGQFPALMRRLGLVIDLKIPFDAALAGATQVKLVLAWTSATQTKTVTPRTPIELTASVFRPAEAAGADFDNGLLKLNDPDLFEIGQMDVDGSGLKLINLAAKLTVPPVLATTVAHPIAPAAALLPPAGAAGRAAVAPAPAANLQPNAAATQFAHLTPVVGLATPKPPQAALPALRSTGFWVARHDRVQVLAAAMMKVRSHNTKLAAAGATSDEVVLDAGQLIRGYRPDVWDEQTKKWYSLCDRQGAYFLKQLNRTLNGRDEGRISPAATHPETDPTALNVHESLFRWENWSLCAPRPGKAVKGDNSAPGDNGQFGLSASFTPTPGTLPRLRYGHHYRLRARVVDLAGNSLAVDKAGDGLASPLMTFFRAEPVPPPVVIPRTDLTGAPGESVLGLTIRSRNYGVERDTVPTDFTVERHLAPPRTSEQMAEMHGRFDDPADGVKGGLATYNLIADREKNPPPFADVAQYEIPYLPDPLAAGILVRLQPEPFAAAPAEQVLQIPFTGTWPSVHPIRMELYEPAAAGEKMTFNEARRLLRVPLRKGDAAQLQVSSYLRPEDLKLMEVWRWTTEHFVAPLPKVRTLPAPDQLQLHRELHDVTALPRWSAKLALPPADLAKIQTLSTTATSGRSWMITPAVTLDLLHATQQPLGKPAFTALTPQRQIGKTFAVIAGKLTVSGKSAAKVDLLATWDEPVDIIGHPKPEVLHGKQSVGEQHLARPDTSVSLNPTHEFGDTKYRHVTYQAVETTRFRECFGFAQADIDSGKYILTRATEKEADVLSSARPQAPKVLYVIPTFGWSQTSAGNKVTSKRSGGGLRIYLERPWYSSGDKEELGVVLPSSPAPRVGAAAVAARFTGQSNVAESLRPFVTQWGADPLWRTDALPKLLLTPNDFTRAAHRESDLTLDELPGAARVQVAGHEVAYDEERQLWYCDVELDSGAAYYPFIRLALARYQPNSIKTATADVKLSRVVLADFVQLAPDRTAVVTREANKSHLSLTVSGPSYVESSLGRLPASDLAQVEVTVERQDPKLATATAWVGVPEAVFPLKLSTLAMGGNVWTGDITLPTAQAGAKYRLVVREHEMYQVDPTKLVVAAVAQISRGRRLVYADVIEI